jgi:hypothetical protein
MANRAEYIQLEAGDDVSTVRDRLSFLRGDKVLLIWPEDGTALTRKLDLVLIQREAMRRAIRLALVTHDPQVITHAEELNISTFETIGASDRGRWKRGRSKVFTNRFQRPKDEPIPDDLKDVVSRIYAEETAAEKRWRIIRRMVGGVIFLVVAAVIGVVLLPSATVRLTPAQSRLDVAAEIIASPQTPGIDIENRIIPSTRISIEISDGGTTETTGEIAATDATASGSVIFINETDTPTTIPAGTVVTTGGDDPVQFRTTEEAQLAGGAIGFQIEVPIEAIQTSAGDGGNVDSGTINTIVGPLANTLVVRNLNPTSGGTTRTQRAVTQADYDNLLPIVRQQIQTRAYLEMQARLTETQCIILESVRISEEREDWMSFSAPLGQISDTLSLTMRAVVEAYVIDEQFAQQIVLAQMAGNIQEGQVIRPDTVSYDLGCDAVTSFDPPTGQSVFTMEGSGIVTSMVDADSIEQALIARPVNDATAYLVTDLPLQQGYLPEITVWPEGWPIMPLLPFRVSVELQDITSP